MNVPSRKNKPPRLNQILATFPRRHLVTASILCAGLFILFIASPSKPVAAKRQSQTIELPFNKEMQELLPDVTEPMSVEIIPEIQWHKELVRAGDNLSLIFQRAGLSDRDLYEFMSGNPKSKSLTRIHPGHELEFHIEDQKLMGLRYRQNQLSSELFTRIDVKKFDHKTNTLQPDIHTAYREAIINDSLFLAGQKVKMDANLIMELANIFGWDIDFGLDIRKGDQFKVLYEERFLDGEKIGNGNILAAEFTNQKVTFRAVRYQDSKGNTHYYTPEGKSMRKAFLRAPLDFRRISSNFNPKRLHPIYKTVRPHRGTDYAASTGTPIWAAGDGKVLRASYSKANGNYIVLQHGNNIQTKYLHLSKRRVKTGQRVKQRQIIGNVGSTGYSTAPHLHYEFLLDGVHRNPRTILEKLPKTQAIAASEMERFNQATQPILTSLDDHHRQILLAKGGRE
ncbi:peptidoglycan DD-metalloendopeptidase family protein [Aestuariicella hydrocarbonica]|uniref:Peptidoglycan DD-metalloendopeptidase family protein n=1 Tax=Pseudomaricurvus hydrocarbonicus TaxID=1470433 RepID=A0A9E5T4R0_9GAMM|nr:peptidoglycan DD-metalloendopeptidase family protein [Aestuariicella hydrocarbonica]NHO68194.1 peptidoglycan DD-metalloendopeptidase family protein [Aestuariicella hydrocarbonica]